MDIISFNEASTANGRIEKINANPDSTSGIVTQPSVIASGETVTIPAGRTAILANTQVDGVLNIDGEVFIPSGATAGDLEEQIARKVGLTDVHNAISKPTPVDSDELGLFDSASSFSLKKLTWSNLKATLLTYFDTLYSRTTSMFGIGQTWQDMTSQRALGITYTNSTGKPITVVLATNSSGNYTINIGGVAIIFYSGNYPMTFIIPTGSTYLFTGASFVRWAEIR